MSVIRKTYLYCLDDHKSFSEEVRKRFTDTARYRVEIFHNRDEMLSSLNKYADIKRCRVAILGIHDSGENFETTTGLVASIKKTDSRAGIIILTPPGRSEEIMKSIKFNVDAFIARNNNSVLRIHNTVKKLISEYNLHYYRRLRNISLYSLLLFLAVSVIVAALTYFKLHGYS